MSRDTHRAYIDRTINAVDVHDNRGNGTWAMYCGVTISGRNLFIQSVKGGMVHVVVGCRYLALNEVKRHWSNKHSRSLTERQHTMNLIHGGLRRAKEHNLLGAFKFDPRLKPPAPKKAPAKVVKRKKTAASTWRRLARR